MTKRERRRRPEQGRTAHGTRMERNITVAYTVEHVERPTAWCGWEIPSAGPVGDRNHAVYDGSGGFE